MPQSQINTWQMIPNVAERIVMFNKKQKAPFSYVKLAFLCPVTKHEISSWQELSQLHIEPRGKYVKCYQILCVGVVTVNL